MKSSLVEYEVIDRKKTNVYSCIVEAKTVHEARKLIARNGGKVLKATRVA